MCFEDFLSHHGILGQKWGVRRFQNPDGSLTEKGKARVAKRNLGYLNVPVKEKKRKAKERLKVSNAYNDEYWKAIDKGMPKNDPSDQGRQLWDKYKGRYSQALLKDLRLRDTREARKSVKKVLKSIDIDYNYDGPVKWKDGMSDIQYQKAWEKAEKKAAKQRDRYINYKKYKR